MASPLAANGYTSASLKALATVQHQVSANGLVKIAAHPHYRVVVSGTTITVEVLLPDTVTGMPSWVVGAQYTN